MMVSAPAVLWEELQSTPDVESHKQSFLSNTNFILNCELFQTTGFMGLSEGRDHTHMSFACSTTELKAFESPLPKIVQFLGM